MRSGLLALLLALASPAVRAEEPFLVRPQAPIQYCAAVVLYFDEGRSHPKPADSVLYFDVGRSHPKPADSGGGLYLSESTQHEIARLDTRGKWVVQSWLGVEQAARVPPPAANYACILNELLARRASLPPPDQDGDKCIGDTWTRTQAVIDSDPIMAACRDPVACKPGDICS